jgi:hypothetical protein
MLKSLAFLHRAVFLRPFGRMSPWGENTEQRALKWLQFLDEPSQSLAFQIGVENLIHEYDLFIDEAALLDSCLQLQVRAFELASEFPPLDYFLVEMMKKWPVSNLVAATVARAYTDGAEAISIEIREDPDCKVIVSMRHLEAWKVVGEFPSDLGPAVRGSVVRMKAIGYERMRPYLWESEKLPEHLAIDIQQDGKITISIGSKH